MYTGTLIVKSMPRLALNVRYTPDIWLALYHRYTRGPGSLLWSDTLAYSGSLMANDTFVGDDFLNLSSRKHGQGFQPQKLHAPWHM